MLKWRVVTRSGLDRGLRRVVDCGAAIAAMGRIERNVTTLHDDNLRLIGFLTAVGAHNTIRGPRLAANITSLLVGLGELEWPVGVDALDDPTSSNEGEKKGSKKQRKKEKNARKDDGTPKGAVDNSKTRQKRKEAKTARKDEAKVKKAERTARYQAAARRPSAVEVMARFISVAQQRRHLVSESLRAHSSNKEDVERLRRCQDTIILFLQLFPDGASAKILADFILVKQNPVRDLGNTTAHPKETDDMRQAFTSTVELAPLTDEEREELRNLASRLQQQGMTEPLFNWTKELSMLEKVKREEAATANEPFELITLGVKGLYWPKLRVWPKFLQGNSSGKRQRRRRQAPPSDAIEEADETEEPKESGSGDKPDLDPKGKGKGKA